MFDHLSLVVHDLARSRAFYEAALEPLGIRVLSEHADSVAFGRERPQLWLGESASPRPPSQVHIAFTAACRADVDAFHRAALAAGGRDNGKPGLRPQYHEHYYGGFVLDPDGSNIEAVCRLAPSPDSKDPA